MAHYLLRITLGDEFAWVIVEADSAKRAADETAADDAQVEVWTLRTPEPRTFTIRTESVRTITQT